MEELKKWNYSNKQNIKTTFDIGEITPIYWNLLYPGETLKKQDFRNITRMITPIYPTLDNPEINIFTFAVPTRLLGLDLKGTNEIKGNIIENFSVENTAINIINWKYPDAIPQPTQQNNFYFYKSFNKFYNSQAMKNNGLLKKFGFWREKRSKDYHIPGSAANKNTPFQVHYLLAYWKIYNDFFKNKQLETFNYKELIKNLTINGEKRSNWWYSGSVEGIAGGDFEELKTKINQAATYRFLDCIALGNTKNEYLNELNFDNYETMITQDWEQFKKVISQNFNTNKRIQNKIQKGNIKDTILAVWNESTELKDSVKLIGYEKYNQTINQVINQAKGSNNSQALGEIGGLSVTYNEGELVKDFHTTEPTIIMTLVLANYDLSLNGAIDTTEWNTDPNEFTPGMEIPQVPQYGDFMPLNFGGIQGYKPAFQYLRNKKNVVAGEILDKWSNWTYCKDFQNETAITEIGLNLLKINKKPFKDTLISTDQDSFISEWEFITDIERSITPKLILENELLKGE